MVVLVVEVQVAAVLVVDPKRVPDLSIIKESKMKRNNQKRTKIKDLQKVTGKKRKS